MAQSSDEPGRRRKPKAEPDPGYEVLPDDDEPHDAEYRRRRWRDDEDDDQAPARRRRRPSGRKDRVRRIRLALGIVCSVTSVVVALVAVGAVAGTVLGPINGGRARLSKGWLTLLIFLFGVAWYQGRAAVEAFFGEPDRENLRVGMWVSIIAAGILILPAGAGLVVLGGHDVIGTVLLGVLAFGIWIGAAGVLMGVARNAR
jgi:hypothetical protein